MFFWVVFLQTQFQDISTCMIMTSEGLDNLNTKLETPVPLTRFRPNIVVTGTKGIHDEVGNISFCLTFKIYIKIYFKY